MLTRPAAVAGDLDAAVSAPPARGPRPEPPLGPGRAAPERRRRAGAGAVAGARHGWPRLCAAATSAVGARELGPPQRRSRSPRSGWARRTARGALPARKVLPVAAAHGFTHSVCREAFDFISLLRPHWQPGREAAPHSGPEPDHRGLERPSPGSPGSRRGSPELAKSEAFTPSHLPYAFLQKNQIPRKPHFISVWTSLRHSGAGTTRHFLREQNGCCDWGWGAWGAPRPHRLGRCAHRER